MPVHWGTRRRPGAAARVRRGTPGPRARGEQGFTVLETTIALSLIFGVMLGLFASLDSGIKGLLTGRQRSGATAVAKEVIEKARSVPYDDVGHDVENDTTLASDGRVTGTAPDYQYTPEGVEEAEDLVAAIDAHFPTHQWTQVRDGSSFHVTVYVTWNDELVGDRRKRLTVEVVHTPEQYDPELVENAVRLSTFLTLGAAPQCVSNCSSVVANQSSGMVTVSNGGVSVSGTIAGTSFSATEIRLPTATGAFTANSQPNGTPLRRETSGVARGLAATMTLASGAPSGSGCSVSGTTGTCPGTLAATTTDNDGGSVAPEHQSDGPRYSAEGSLVAGVAGGGLTTSLAAATGEVSSKSSVASCVTCSPVVGDGDGYPYTENVASVTPSATVSMGTIGILQGNLVQMTGAGAARATVDDDPVAGKELITSQGQLQLGGLKLLDIAGSDLSLPAGFTSAVSVDAVSATATAQVGPTAASPSVTGPSFNVNVWDTLGVGVQGYRTVPVTVGVSSSTTANATFNVLKISTGTTAAVTVQTTVSSGTLQTSCDTNCAGSAEARLQNWLRVTLRVTVVEAGVTKADLTLDAAYGSITAVAGYTAP